MIIVIIALMLLAISLLLTREVPTVKLREVTTPLKTTISTFNTQSIYSITKSTGRETSRTDLRSTKSVITSTTVSNQTISRTTTPTKSLTTSLTTILNKSKSEVQITKIKFRNVVALCKCKNKEALGILSINLSAIFNIDIDNYVRRGHAFIYISNGKLIVGVQGLLHSIGIYEEGSEYPKYIILPLQGRRVNVIQADYTYINETLTVLMINVSKIINVINDGNYKLIIWSGYRWNPREVLIADFMKKNSTIYISNIKLEEKPANLVCEGGEYGTEVSSYLTSLVCYHRSNLLEVIRSKIFSNENVTEVTSKIWRVLEWVSDNIRYDYDKEAKGIPYINNPLTTINRGKGVCIDYSVLISAALQSVNVSPTYILSIKSVNHAVAAIYLNNSLFILDQHPPPMEIQDYIEYILKSRTVRADIIQIKGGKTPVVEVFSNVDLSKLFNYDSYPQDSIPYLDCEVSMRLSKYLGLTTEPKLLSLIESNLLVGKLTLLVRPISGLRMSEAVPVTYFYNPVFKNQWIDFLAMKALSIARKYFSEYIGNESYVWAHIGNYSMSIAVVNYEIPNVTIKIRDGSVTLMINYRYNKISKVNVLIYKKGEVEPILGIAPKGYTYEGIKTIHANEWIIDKYNALIKFNAKDILKNLSSGEYILAVWVNGKLSYGLIINIK